MHTTRRSFQQELQRNLNCYLSRPGVATCTFWSSVKARFLTLETACKRMHCFCLALLLSLKLPSEWGGGGSAKCDSMGHNVKKP